MSLSSQTPQLSIIVPCYNERENIRPFIEEIREVFKEESLLKWEIIFVDDNSPDETIKIIREESQKDSRIRGLRRIGRRGLSSAVLEGVMSVSSEIIVVMDGDLQHDPATLTTMLHKILEEDHDLVVASRYVEGGNSDGLANKKRHFISRFAIFLVQKLLGIALTDPMSGFFMMKRHFIEENIENLRGEGFKILLDIIHAVPQKMKTTEVATLFRQRSYGESKLDYKVIFYFLLFMVVSFKKKNMKSHSR